MAKRKILARFSKTQLIVFAAVFAVIGGYFVWRAFAQAPSIPSFSMSASPNPAPWNSTVNLYWSIPGYSSNLDCNSNVGSPSSWTAGGGNWSKTLTVNNAQSGFQWYVICYSTDWPASRDGSIFVNVDPPPPPPPPPPPAPTLSFSASPTTIIKGSSSKLTWNSSNASSCTASGAWSGSKPVDGSQNVSPSATSTYSLSCSGSGGSVAKSAKVTVNPPKPTVSLSANPSTINKSSNSTLSWSSTNATSCSAAWTSSKAASGSKSVQPSSTTSYSITCTNVTGSGSATKTVYVSGTTTPKPIVRLVASPGSISYNSYTYLQWSSDYADSCSASWTSSKTTVGTKQVGRLTSNKTYSITCKGNGGSSTKSVSVSVAKAPANCPPSCPTPKAPPPPDQDIAPTPEDDFLFSGEDITAEDQPEVAEEPTKKGASIWSFLIGGLIGLIIDALKHGGR